MELLVVVLLAAITAIATGIGVFPVYWFNVGPRGLGLMWGLSAGIMAALSVLELLLPSLRTDTVPLGLGALAGVVFVLVAARVVDAGSREHTHADGTRHRHIPSGGLSSLSLLMFLVFTVHSAPEGVGIGAALKDNAVTGVLVTIAIAIHNIPEGTAVGVGLRADDVPMWRAFTMAVITSVPQPLLAPLVYIVAVGPWLAAGMGFAGGAMLALVATEVAPEGWGEHRSGFAVGASIGVALGILLHFALPVPAGM